MDVQQLIAELMALPETDREFVVNTVYASLPPAEIPPEHWEELNRRLDAIEANPDEYLTPDEVLARLNKKP